MVNYAAMLGWGKAGILLVTVAGCGRTVTEADCTQIKDNMRAAWTAEAKKAAPEGADKASAVVRSEGERLVGDWMAECKKELMGRRVEPKEMDCLLQAKSIGEINKCSEPWSDADPVTRPLISIVSPCFDEVLVVGLFHRELCAVVDAIDACDFEIVYVDDGSDDGTLDALNEIAAEDPRVRVCSFSRNFGHQIALTAGLDHAVGDAIVMIDSDLQHPPSLIPAMIATWRGGVDVVSAVRRDTEGVSIFKVAASRGFYVVLNLLSTVRVPEGAADFCLLSRRTADTLRGMRERHRFLRGMISWAGFRRAFLPYTAAARAAGQSKYTLVKMLRMGVDAILSFSTAPIGLASRVGVFVVLLGFGYLAWNFAVAFRTGKWAPGWASLIAVVMVLGGTQILFIGLIGQYLARVFEELKGRPSTSSSRSRRSPRGASPRRRSRLRRAEPSPLRVALALRQAPGCCACARRPGRAPRTSRRRRSPRRSAPACRATSPGCCTRPRCAGLPVARRRRGGTGRRRLRDRPRSGRRCRR